MKKFNLEEWKKGRARPGQKEMMAPIKITPKYPEKNAGLPKGEFENDHLHCICTICNHKYQGECEIEDCVCCSSLCT